jgi:GT2 family glycosyltransferase
MQTGEQQSQIASVSLPATSLIICTRNRPRMLSATINSVLNGEEGPAELVIVDDSDARHPDLGTEVIAGGPKVRYLWTRSKGIGRARNAGIAVASNPILAFIDDDMLVAPNWFASLSRALMTVGPRAVVTGRVLPGKADFPDSFAPSVKTDRDPAVYRGRVGKDVLFTNNMAIFRSAIEEVGAFDERFATPRFPSSEDNDYCFRLLEAGFEIHYVPDAVVYHRAWRRRRDFAKLEWDYGRGQGAYYAKYLSLRDRYMLGRMIRDIFSRVAHAVLATLRGPNDRLYGDISYVLGTLSGAVEWLLEERGTK